MWEISSEIVLATSHQIRGVPAAGGRVHEHRLRVRAFVRAAHLDAVGWVLDFHELDAALSRLVAPFEGRFINAIPPWDDVNPTRENLARFIADRLAAELSDDRVRVHRVEVGEGAHCASFEP